MRIRGPSRDGPHRSGRSSRGQTTIRQSARAAPWESRDSGQPACSVARAAARDWFNGGVDGDTQATVGKGQIRQGCPPVVGGVPDTSRFDSGPLNWFGSSAMDARRIVGQVGICHGPAAVAEDVPCDTGSIPACRVSEHTIRRCSPVAAGLETSCVSDAKDRRYGRHTNLDRSSWR